MIAVGQQGNSIALAVAFSALRFTIGPLGNERPNKWIHQSVCVLLSVCIWDVVRPRRAQSPGTQRKGMPSLAGLMNGWHAAPWQRRMWQPPSCKRGAVLNYRGEIMWCWPPPLPSYIPSWLSPRWWKNQRGKGGEKEYYIILLSDCLCASPHQTVYVLFEGTRLYHGHEIRGLRANYTVYLSDISKWWEITNTSLNRAQYLIKALDKITGLNKRKGIHQ